MLSHLFRVRLILVILFPAFSCCPGFAQNKAAIGYETYCNSRFGYCIDFPKGLLTPAAESDNGDGRVFKNKHGKVSLRVFGRINQDPDGNPMSLKTQFDNDIRELGQDTSANVLITYRKLGKRFYIISGYRSGEIFYRKAIIREEGFCFAILEYPKAESQVFDEVSKAIFSSFK